jgi:restriction system protein
LTETLFLITVLALAFGVPILLLARKRRMKARLGARDSWAVLRDGGHIARTLDELQIWVDQGLVNATDEVFDPRDRKWVLASSISDLYFKQRDGVDFSAARLEWQRSELLREERLRELDNIQAAENQAADELVDEIFRRQADAIQKFIEIAERRVSRRDEYGDESWGDLEVVLQQCVEKISDREGLDIQAVRAWLRKKPSHSLPLSHDTQRTLCTLQKRLERHFREIHSADHSASRASDLDALDSLTGVEFETFIARALKAAGYSSVVGTPVTGDQGADLIAEKGGRRIAIQAKRHRHAVGNHAVQEVAAAMGFYEADEGWVITTSTFTRSARILAPTVGVRLVDRQMLHELFPESFTESSSGST